MIAVPRRFMLIMGWVSVVFVVLAAVVQLRSQSLPSPAIPALALWVAAFVTAVLDRDPDRLPARKAALLVIAGVCVPVWAAASVDPVHATFGTAGWYVSATACIAVVLNWHRRELLGWIVIACLVVHTVLWAGPQGLDRFSVTATVLLVAVLAGGGWAMQRTADDVRRHAAVARTELEFRAAQDAFHMERQVRLLTTGKLALPMLQRIADAGGSVDPADRAECRVLEQTIRDEIRGRRLLNDALRDQIMAHRRNGAIVQVNDDGGIDDIDPAVIDPMLTRIAEAISGLRSDRIIIRTAPADSSKALSVVAMSTDPMAAALGLDDGDDTVDLWLEFDRPEARV